MGKDLYDQFPKAKAIFEQANDILGERFSDILFNASEDLLMDTRYTQMGIFLYE
jgi:[acyl-carrier-protein] S-malonyltransferase